MAEVMIYTPTFFYFDYEDQPNVKRLGVFKTKRSANLAVLKYLWENDRVEFSDFEDTSFGGKSPSY